MEAMGIKDLKKAQADIRESDRRSMKFVRDALGLDWTDARNFNLYINCSVASFSVSAGMIILPLLREKRAGRTYPWVNRCLQVRAGQPELNDRKKEERNDTRNQEDTLRY